MHKLTWENGCRPWLAASNDDTRPQLTRVLLDGAGYLVATNTHMLAVVKADVPKEYDGAMLPAEFFSAAMKHRAAIHLDEERAFFVASFGEVSSLVIRPTEKEKFLDWRKALGKGPETPAQCSSVSFDPAYLALIGRLLDSCTVRFVFGHQELSPVLFISDECPESFVILMPKNEHYKPGYGQHHAWERVRSITQPNGDAA